SNGSLGLVGSISDILPSLGLARSELSGPLRSPFRCFDRARRRRPRRRTGPRPRPLRPRPNGGYPESPDGVSPRKGGARRLPAVTKVADFRGFCEPEPDVSPEVSTSVIPAASRH